MRDREGAKQDLREHALALKRRELQVGDPVIHFTTRSACSHPEGHGALASMPLRSSGASCIERPLAASATCCRGLNVQAVAGKV